MRPESQANDENDFYEVFDALKDVNDAYSELDELKDASIEIETRSQGTSKRIIEKLELEVMKQEILMSKINKWKNMYFGLIY